jgi:hypothetical protein
MTLSFPTKWPVYVKNLISDSFLPNQLTSLCQKPDIRLFPSQPSGQSMSKTWYQTPSFQTNWPVYVKNLISDSFLPNQLTSLCQKPDIRLLPSKPIDQSMSKTWYQTPSFQTNWPVGVKNLISDYFLSQPSDLSLCQKPDIKLLPSQPTDLSLCQKPDIRLRPSQPTD